MSAVQFKRFVCLDVIDTFDMVNQVIAEMGISRNKMYLPYLPEMKMYEWLRLIHLIINRDGPIGVYIDEETKTFDWPIFQNQKLLNDRKNRFAKLKDIIDPARTVYFYYTSGYRGLKSKLTGNVDDDLSDQYVSDETVCVICMENLDYDYNDPPYILPKCHHEFHMKCIHNLWKAQGNVTSNEVKCPTCRKINKVQYVKDFYFTSL